MTRNQLPDGVGKKIVEALNRLQTEGETPAVKSHAVIEEKNENIITETDLSDFEKTVENVPETDNLNFSDDFIIEEEAPVALEQDTQDFLIDTDEEPDFGFNDEPVAAPSVDREQVPAVNLNQNTFEEVKPAVQEPAVIENTFKQTMQSFNAVNETPGVQKPAVNPAQTSSAVKIPYNVAILNNLIATLPPGVNKQVGAQIIRQTLEATGLSMTGVLKEAQELQEQLNGSTRECMIKVQEYKTNIMQLEQKVQEYKKHISQVNDLISLFLLTDKK